MVFMVKAYKYYQSLCLFLEDVVCIYRHSVHKRSVFSVAKFCLSCSHYKAFVLMMDEEDERIMDEIDRERAVLDGVVT